MKEPVKVLSISLKESQLQRILKEAEKDMRSTSSFIRHAVETYIKEHSDHDN